jgi:SAM-dependent methyltransferase
MTDEIVYRQTREAWAHIWQETDVERELETRASARARRLRGRFLPYLPSGERLLEAGCGLGAEMIGLAEAGLRVVGLDYAVAAASRLKRFRPVLHVAAGDVHALPFPDDTFGAYLSFGVLEHFVFGTGPALREAHRVLRPGGVLVLTVPAPNFVWRLMNAKRRLGGQSGFAHGYFETAYSAGAIARDVTGAGFAILEWRPIDHEFTLWGCGRIFRAPGYYRTSRLAETLGAVLAVVLPESMSFATLVIARKEPAA